METHQQPQDYGRWLGVWSPYPDMLHVLLRDSEGVGVCGLQATGEAGVFECGFTGILPQASSQGLTTPLKAHALLDAQGRGIRRVVTQVREDNPAMRAINRRLGFVAVEP